MVWWQLCQCYRKRASCIDSLPLSSSVTPVIECLEACHVLRMIGLVANISENCEPIHMGPLPQPFTIQNGLGEWEMGLVVGNLS